MSRLELNEIPAPTFYVPDGLTPIKRIATVVGLEPIFPAELARESVPGLNQLLRFMRSKKPGVIDVTHFGENDFPTVLRLLMKHCPPVRNVPILAPIAWHQYYNKHALHAIQDLSNVVLTPIVTEDTILAEQKLNAENKPVPWPHFAFGSGGKHYLDLIPEFMDNNGLLVFASSQSRQPKLYPHGKRTLEAALRAAHAIPTKKQQEQLRDIFVGFIGLDAHGITDYNALRKMKPGQRFTARVKVMSNQELIKHASDHGLSISAEGFEQLKSVASSVHLPTAEEVEIYSRNRDN